VNEVAAGGDLVHFACCFDGRKNFTSLRKLNSGKILQMETPSLHLSGFGPMTTATPDMVIQLFLPYVNVDEVVPKSGFMFLFIQNTS